MPLLGWLASFLGLSLSAETMRITAKVARVVAFVGIVIALTAALIAGVTTGLSSISASLPSEVLLVAQALLPPNAVGCISVVVSAHVARYIYDWNVKIADKLSD